MASIKIRSQVQAGFVELKVLINHPMENGRNRDPLSGELIPAHFIEELLITLNERTLITAQLGVSVSKNPFFSFRLKSAHSGDKIRVIWRDNHTMTDSAELILS